MRISGILALSIAPALFGAVNGVDTFLWRGKLPPGQVIEIKAVNGGIHAERADGDALEVLAQKTGDGASPGQVQVQVVEHAGGVTVCAVYPGFEGEGDCRPGVTGASGAGSDVTVDFTVRVPAGVRFVGRTVNGPVQASALRADAEAHTVNGDIHLVTSGGARAETVNGSISASLGKITDALDFKTVNGRITIEMPAADLDVHADTVNGPISTDFRLPVRGTLVSKHLAGKIGHGGPEVNLSTVNGGINLRHSTHRAL